MKAYYGSEQSWKTVTDLVYTDTTPFRCDNDFFKCDPNPGRCKYLRVEYEEDEKRPKRTEYYVQNEIVSLNEPKEHIERDNKLVTFVIPSIGRPTLKRSLQSLEQQTYKIWKALVVFDGLPLDETNKMEHVKFISIPKIGFKNCAGEVRNKGIMEVDTEWTAFLDDDDIVTNDYCAQLEKEIKMAPRADVILFRMIHTEYERVLPSRKYISLGDVGISFACKTSVLKKIKFNPSAFEDFDLLNRLEKSSYKIQISDHITYIVLHGR